MIVRAVGIYKAGKCPFEIPRAISEWPIVVFWNPPVHPRLFAWAYIVSLN